MPRLSTSLVLVVLFASPSFAQRGAAPAAQSGSAPQLHHHLHRRPGIRRSRQLRSSDDSHAEPGSHGRRGPALDELLRRARLHAVARAADDRPLRDSHRAGRRRAVPGLDRRPSAERGHDRRGPEAARLRDAGRRQVAPRPPAAVPADESGIRSVLRHPVLQRHGARHHDSRRGRLPPDDGAEDRGLQRAADARRARSWSGRRIRPRSRGATPTRRSRSSGSSRNSRSSSTWRTTCRTCRCSGRRSSRAAARAASTAT